MISGDTIAAISSATGSAARMILRLSGPESAEITRRFWDADIPKPGGASHGRLIVRGMSVPGWLYFFQSPRSYTGEDCVELHLPGNPLLARMLLEDLLAAGARAAEPGEFTARAYFNGRLDLTEAEGVAATISAGNEQELSAARRLMSGELARRVTPILDRLADTLALLEVGIDFSDEDVTFLSAAELRARIEEADTMLRQLLEESTRFERLTHEPSVVLVGRPNAGKSTLLNKLTGHERAVVSQIAGTTRDVLSAEVMLQRGVVRVTDVAGLEEEGSEDPRLAALLGSDERSRIAERFAEDGNKFPAEKRPAIRLRSSEPSGAAEKIVGDQENLPATQPFVGRALPAVETLGGQCPPYVKEGAGEGSFHEERTPRNRPSPQPSPLSTGERGSEDPRLAAPLAGRFAGEGNKFPTAEKRPASGAAKQIGDQENLPATRPFVGRALPAVEALGGQCPPYVKEGAGEGSFHEERTPRNGPSPQPSPLSTGERGSEDRSPVGSASADAFADRIGESGFPHDGPTNASAKADPTGPARHAEEALPTKHLAEELQQQHIDKQMRGHAVRALEQSDHVVLVRDATDPRQPLMLPRDPDLIVWSKIDLMDGRRQLDENAIEISCMTGEGTANFRNCLDRLCFGETSATSSLALNARHILAIEEARAALSNALAQGSAGPEFIALELRESLDALGRITGQVSPDDLLGRVFSAFCIGK